MKTSKAMMETLRLRLLQMNSGGDVEMPVSLLRDMVEDALDFHRAEEALDRGFEKLLSTLDEEKTAPSPVSPIRKRPHLHVVKNPTGGDAA